MEVSDGSDLCYPELLNTSCRKPQLSHTNVVFFRILMSCMSMLTVVLNLLVIISVSHFRLSLHFKQYLLLSQCILLMLLFVFFFASRRLHTPTNLLLLSLAVSDFTVGLVVFPGEIYRTTSCWFLGDSTCLFFNYITCLTVSASIGNMVMISADRYAAICDPLHYPTRVTASRIKVCICLCWFFSGLYSSYLVYVKSVIRTKYFFCYGLCLFMVDYITAVIDLVLVFIAPVTIIIVLYMRVFVVAVSQARAMRSHVTAVSLQHSGTLTSRKSELKAARTLGVLVVVFLTCYCPHYLVTLAGERSRTTFVILLCLVYLNSCMNPLIYALFYPWFRKCVKHIVTLQILQPGSREANIL